MDDAVVDVRTLTDGRLIEVSVKYLSCHPTISVGFSNEGKKIYSGQVENAFLIHSLTVEVIDAAQEMSTVPNEERVVLVDVGGQEGLQPNWMLRAREITPVIFEPIPAEAAKLRAVTGRIPGAKILEYGLSNRIGQETLNLTVASGCSSILMPNDRFARQYEIGRIFDVVGQETIACQRYDALFVRGEAPAPDVIKIDVQGFEYQVLLGFGNLLDGCLAIELETHFYPLYREQRLIGDLVTFLADFGFVLRNLAPVPNFDGDLVEADLQFTKRRSEVVTYDTARRRKFDLICRTLGLSNYA